MDCERKLGHAAQKRSIFKVWFPLSVPSFTALWSAKQTNKNPQQRDFVSSVTLYLLVFKSLGDVPALKVSANLFDSQINADEN